MFIKFLDSFDCFATAWALVLPHQVIYTFLKPTAHIHSWTAKYWFLAEVKRSNWKNTESVHIFVHSEIGWFVWWTVPFCRLCAVQCSYYREARSQFILNHYFYTWVLCDVIQVSHETWQSQDDLKHASSKTIWNMTVARRFETWQ